MYCTTADSFYLTSVLLPLGLQGGPEIAGFPHRIFCNTTQDRRWHTEDHANVSKDTRNRKLLVKNKVKDVCRVSHHQQTRVGACKHDD